MNGFNFIEEIKKISSQSNLKELEKSKKLKAEKDKLRQKKLKILNFKILKCALYNIKLILLVNSKTFTLDEFAFALLKSSVFLNDTFEYEYKMKNFIVRLNKYFNDLYRIEYNHLIGYVVVLNNKNYVIPDDDKLMEYINS